MLCVNMDADGDQLLWSAICSPGRLSWDASTLEAGERRIFMKR
jgi:hypothetical protein